MRINNIGIKGGNTTKYSTQTKKGLYKTLLLAALTTLSACSDDDDTQEPTQASYETGVFIDSPVINIDYKTNSNSGKTSASGEFTYLPGEKITFFIGDLVLPEVTAGSVITPIDIAKAANDDIDMQSIIAVNIARLLQTLDLDNDPTNGIEIASDLALNSTINFSAEQQDFETELSAAAPNYTIVDVEAALAHIESVLNERGIDITILNNYTPHNDDTGGGDTGGGDTGGGDTGGGDTGDTNISLTSLPTVITNINSFKQTVNITGGLQKLITLDLAIEQNYASLSLFSGETLLIDNLDVPSEGNSVLKILVTFPQTGNQELTFVGRSTDITLNSVNIASAAEQLVNFTDISESMGLITEDTLKYGGPAVGDVNNDGHYDFITINHNYIPPQLVTNNGNNTVTIERLFPNSQDFHGASLADYDNDGDLDIMVALGGANGTSPTSYALLKNNAGTFENVAVESGITTPARGRAPRWSDFDSDGDLDIMLVNAKTPNDDGPIQLFYRNMGDGTFTPVRVAGLESQNSERILMTDFNGDQIDDLVMYSPLTLWQGNGDFTFTNVTETHLPEALQYVWGINAVTDVDLNNDGKLDLYFAFGKTHYQLSRKSIDFNPTSGSLNIHDDGETGTTLINFAADGDVTLSDLGLTYRQWDGNYPIFLGSAKDRHVVKADGFQPNQLPAEMVNAEETLTITQASAVGWPEDRSVNGLYIGHTGDGQWKAEWVRDQDIYWNVSFTLDTLTDVNIDWVPNNRNGQDILLVNQGDKFVDVSDDWDLPKGGDHWGVTHGDFNNDGWNDLFVYRYGFLKERITDLLLLNTGEGSFITTHMHGAMDVNDNGHGDMGQAFDFDKDGAVDMLSGSEEGGHWYLWKNDKANSNNYLLVDVGYSPLHNIDAMSAQIIVTLESGDVYKKRVASAGEVFSAGIIDTVHFGLGQAINITSVEVKWRNGESVLLTGVNANGIVTTDDASSPTPAAIDLDASTTKVRPNESLSLTPTFTPLNAVPSVQWTSSDNSIATVNEQGVVTGVTDGDVTITVTSTVDNNVSAQVVITVGDYEIVYATDVTISGDNEAFYVGQQTQLTADVVPGNADNQEVIWSSSNESIATVDETGLVSNVSVGNATITASVISGENNETVTDTVDIFVDEFSAISIAYDDDGKYTGDIYADDLFEVTVNYHAGSAQVVNEAGMKFFLREMNSAWGVVNDITSDDTSVAATESGSASVTFDLTNVKLTSELDEGNFYFLFAKFTTADGKSIDKGLWPLNIVAGAQVDTCDANNLLGCGSANAEGGSISDWYAYTVDDYATDLSSLVTFSDEQAKDGAQSIKFSYTNSAQQNFVLTGVEFEVTSEGSYKFDSDVFGANLSSGTDYVIEASIRPAGAPQNSDTYKLWQRKVGGAWQTISTTHTLPVGNYVVGYKVFRPAFSDTLELDVYVDNLSITQVLP
ncbi:FG-GAP-like repeat-containing protein [Colwellia sp. E2M01]|uniref:FG-GAP-like repeat-containing protein n=1 Tax=Colwellia sp. E2M01 TaxID=2841561 RepID=UPI001C098693|nr:FG-GAP-like repeat-containing protein [Colwellia sp. E2M01]MBU2872048.1 VCBS repeat-containing protein [Colwellia sp. E2M01]